MVSCFTGADESGLWLRISMWYGSDALVQGHGIVVLCYCKVVAQRSKHDFGNSSALPWNVDAFMV